MEKITAQFEEDSKFDLRIVNCVKSNDLMGKLLESLGFEYGEFDEENNECVIKLEK